MNDAHNVTDIEWSSYDDQWAKWSYLCVGVSECSVYVGGDSCCVETVVRVIHVHLMVVMTVFDLAHYQGGEHSVEKISENSVGRLKIL
jgi:hypothetical protein